MSLEFYTRKTVLSKPMEIQEPESEIGSIIVDNESVSYVFLLKIYNIYIYT